MKRFKMNKNYTPYQQSLINESEKPSFKTFVWRWASIFCVTLIASLMLINYEITPNSINNWIIVIVSFYIAINLVAIIGLILACGLFSALKFSMNNKFAKLRIHGEISKEYRSTSNFVSNYIKNTKFFYLAQFSMSKFLDFAADWFLFFVLVKVNCPYMAILYAGSLFLQYFLHNQLIIIISSLVPMLVDLVEQEKTKVEQEKTNIDDLMNKLCNTED